MLESTLASETDGTAEKQEEAEEKQQSPGDIAVLLGMQDSETEEMFGGGKENWTEDRSFYIGRIFQTELCGKRKPEENLEYRRKGCYDEVC